MKVRPSELLRYEVLPAQSSSLPLEWDAVFGRAAPLAVEVGFGSGEFLAWWAGTRPDWNLVGLERPMESLVRAARRCALAGAEHVRLVRGDARTLLREIFPTASLDRVVMQFPMPWPKDRHAKHRVSGAGFTATLADVLGPGGVFELVTDQAWFAAEAREAFLTHPSFETGDLETDPPRPFRTRYEQRWLEEGRRIHRFQARLLENAAARRICLPGPMLHVRLPSLPAPEALSGLVGARFAAGGRVAEIKEAFRSETDWLFKVLAADGSFSQLFFLRVGARKGGGALVKVEEHPRPYFTQAVRFLIESVGERLGGGARPSGYTQ